MKPLEVLREDHLKGQDWSDLNHLMESDSLEERQEQTDREKERMETTGKQSH